MRRSGFRRMKRIERRSHIEYYYLTRTSFPYDKGSPAYLKYAVRVDTGSGEVIPYK